MGTRSTARDYRVRSACRPGATPLPSAAMLAWMDLEMTGLDPAQDVIVEIATLLTDDNLELIAEGPDLVVHATEEQLAGMADIVVQMHTRSGLLDQIRASTVSLAEAGAADARLPAPAHHHARYGAVVRQLDRDRSPLPRRLAPRDRGVPALPLGRRVDHEGAGQAVEPGHPGRRPAEGRGPPRPRRHPRERRASSGTTGSHSSSTGRRRPAEPPRDLTPDTRWLIRSGGGWRRHSIGITRSVPRPCRAGATFFVDPARPHVYDANHARHVRAAGPVRDRGPVRPDGRAVRRRQTPTDRDRPRHARRPGGPPQPRRLGASTHRCNTCCTVRCSTTARRHPISTSALPTTTRRGACWSS